MITWRAMCTRNRKECMVHREFTGETVGDCRQAILNAGWRFIRTGQIDRLWCSDCVAKYGEGEKE